MGLGILGDLLNDLLNIQNLKSYTLLIFAYFDINVLIFLQKQSLKKKCGRY